MFKELIEKIRTYNKALETIINSSAAELAEAKKHYGNGDMYTQKEEEVKWKTEKSCETMKNGLAGEIQQAFNTFLTEIDKYISTPIPHEVAETLASLKSAGVKMSPAEAEAIMQKYGDNYMARRVISQTMGLNIYGFDKRLLDDAYEEAKDFVSKGLNGIEKRDLNYYAMALMDDTPENPLNRLEAYRNEFIKVVKAGKPSEIFGLQPLNPDNIDRDTAIVFGLDK